MKARLDWARDGVDWPNHAHSSFVAAGGLKWHVQHWGAGPALVLLHGTAASTHSWRAFAPLLAAGHSVIACDLPGHGFTRGAKARDLTLPGMAVAVGGLLAALNIRPDALIGHSAGAAVAIRMALDGIVRVRKIVGLNAALLPFPGPAGKVAPVMARLLFLNPFAPALFAVQASERTVGRLIRSTGSSLDATGLKLYQRLFESYAHVGGALGMMAQWDLAALARDLPKLTTPLTLIVAASDRAIPSAQSLEVAALAPGVTRVLVEGLGHLAHEEAPAKIAALALQALATPAAV
jgi:magnesium chelatase accessory protein